MGTIYATDGGSVLIPPEHAHDMTAAPGCVCDTTATLEAVHAHLVSGTLDTSILSVSNTGPMFDVLNAATALDIQSLAVPIAEFIGSHIKTCTKEEAAAFLGTGTSTSPELRVYDPREPTWLGALE